MILNICGVITGISAASGIIYKLLKTFLSNTIEDLIDKSVKEAISEVNNRLDYIEKSLKLHIDEASKTDESLKTAFMRNTRDRINEAYSKYTKIGKIDAHTLFVLEELFDSYVSLGGNHFTKRQMEELRNLRVLKECDFDYEVD